MSKKGLVLFTLGIIYKLQLDEDAEKLVDEIVNTVPLYPKIVDFTITSTISTPYLYVEVNIDNIELINCFEFIIAVKDYFTPGKIVCMETRYIVKSDEIQVLEEFYG